MDCAKACATGEPGHVQMVGHFQEAAAEQASFREEMLEEMMELRIENDRLRSQLEAMEQHMEMLQQIAEVKAENAALQAKLEMWEQHHPVRLSPLPPSHAAMTPQGTFAVFGAPHPQPWAPVGTVPAVSVSAALSPNHCKSSPSATVRTPASTVTGAINQWQAHPAEAKVLSDQLQGLNKSLKAKTCPCKQAKTASEKPGSN